MVEFWGENDEQVKKQADALVADLLAEQLGYAYPLLFGEEANKAWEIRKVGLGLIRNLPGDTQSVNYKTHAITLRTNLIANFRKQMKLASIVPRAFNAVFDTTAIRKVANKIVGFLPDRLMPFLHNTTLKNWWKKHNRNASNANTHSKVYLFCDDFTNYNDVEIGKRRFCF